MEPKLRNVNKAIAPYALNKFPDSFVEAFAREVVYMEATKKTMSLEGKEWEQIFAKCINAKWTPSNVGLDDIKLENCCWSAKTVSAGCKNIANQKTVRLISGRNSTFFSYGVEQGSKEAPDRIGEMILGIWNERVSGIRQIFKFARTVVLVKAKDFRDYLIFETDTVRYEPELYVFSWNKNGNLEGWEKVSGEHKFTWQPSGSQFTVIEKIPEDRIHIQIKEIKKIDPETVLQAISYDKSWYKIID